MEQNKIYNLNFLDNTLPDKCAQLIIADPPYFEVKGSFDFIWKSFDDYLKDVEKWAIECKRILSDNGTLFWYGHAKKLAYSQIILDKYFNLENNLVWYKFDSQTNKSIAYLNCFAPTTERILMYSKNENFDFFRNYLKEARSKKGMTIKQVAKEMGVYGALYGFYEQNNTGSQIPTKDQYNKLVKILELDIEYDKIARCFNNEGMLNDVLKFSQEAHITGNYDHDTCKPETLTRALILTCSRENDLVVVPFAGSGTECAMSAKENRNFIGFDIESKYVEMANKRCAEHLRTQALFSF